MRWINKPLFWLIAICGVNLFLYWPSLLHLPKSDLLYYFLDTAGRDDFWSLARSYYSYDRVRLVAPGDVFAFRPLGFIFFAFEKSFFGTHFLCWQAVGIILHLLLLVLLFKLLYELSGSSIFSGLLVFWFCSIPQGIDAVIWTGINFYLIFLIAAVLLLLLLCRILRNGRAGIRDIVFLLIFSLVAVFTYDLGAFLCLGISGGIVFGLGAGSRGRMGAIVVILSVILFYFSFNLWDYISRHDYIAVARAVSIARDGTPHSGVQVFLFSAFRTLFNWLFMPVFSFATRWEASYRVLYFWDLRAMFNPVSIIYCAVVIFILNFWRKAISRQCVDKNRYVLRAVLFFLLVLVLSFTYTRCLPQGGRYLPMSGYYFYMVWLFLVIAAAAVVDLRLIVSSRWYLVPVSAFVIFLLIYNSANIFLINNNYARLFSAQRRWVGAVNRFIDSHKGEKDFSYAAFDRPVEDMRFTFDVLYADDLSRQVIGPVPVYLSYLYFSRYFSTSPKYIVRYYDGKLTYVTR